MVLVSASILFYYIREKPYLFSAVDSFGTEVSFKPMIVSSLYVAVTSLGEEKGFVGSSWECHPAILFEAFSSVSIKEAIVEYHWWSLNRSPLVVSQSISEGRSEKEDMV